MLRTLFIVSGGKNVGTGHIKRCILLSDELKKKNFYFIGTKDNKYFKIPNNINYEIKKFNKKNILTIIKFCEKLKIQSVIIDHTNLNFEIQKSLYKKYFLTVFDNQQKINFIADVLINASPKLSIKNYKNRIKNKNIQLLLGYNYSLISLPPKKTKKNKPNSIFLCFGGGDDKQVLFKFLRYVKKTKINIGIKFNLIIGPLNENYQKYKEYIKKSNLKNINLIFNPKNIYEIMQKCFLAVVSPGTLFYELSYYKKPTYIIYLNQKQKNLAMSWYKNGLIVNYQSHSKINFEKIKENIYLFNGLSNKYDLKVIKYANNSKKIIKKLIRIYKKFYG
jgi:spore coat polysaccharide biosynthesis predicted glycosyltransferase SpsG